MILRKKFSDVSLFHMYYRVLNMRLGVRFAPPELSRTQRAFNLANEQLKLLSFLSKVGLVLWLPLCLRGTNAGAGAGDLYRSDTAAPRSKAQISLSRSL